MKKVFEVKVRGWVKDKERTLSLIIQHDSYDNAAVDALNLCVLRHNMLHTARVLSVAEKEYNLPEPSYEDDYLFLVKFTELDVSYEEVYCANKFDDCYNKIVKQKKQEHEKTGIAFTGEILSLSRKKWAAVYRYDAVLFLSASENMLRLHEGLFYEPKEETA